MTGSAATAKLIQRSAADTLTPSIFELGGKSPNIVFADADLDAAAFGVTIPSVYTFNAGQACVAGSRILVERPVLDEMVGPHPPDRRIPGDRRSFLAGDADGPPHLPRAVRQGRSLPRDWQEGGGSHLRWPPRCTGGSFAASGVLGRTDALHDGGQHHPNLPGRDSAR